MPQCWHHCHTGMQCRSRFCPKRPAYPNMPGESEAHLCYFGVFPCFSVLDANDGKLRARARARAPICRGRAAIHLTFKFCVPTPSLSWSRMGLAWVGPDGHAECSCVK